MRNVTNPTSDAFQCLPQHPAALLATRFVRTATISFRFSAFILLSLFPSPLAQSCPLRIGASA